MGIQILAHHRPIALVAGSKHYYLKVLRQGLQSLDGLRADVDASLYNLAAWELQVQNCIVGYVCVIVAVDECLVQVKDQCIFGGGFQLPDRLNVCRFLGVFQKLQELQ